MVEAVGQAEDSTGMLILVPVLPGQYGLGDAIYSQLVCAEAHRYNQGRKKLLVDARKLELYDALCALNIKIGGISLLCGMARLCAQHRLGKLCLGLAQRALRHHSPFDNV